MDEVYGRYHARDGLYFQRTYEGGVQVCWAESSQSDAPLLRELELQPGEWASLVASVSRGGETGSRSQAALAFHDDEPVAPAEMESTNDVAEAILAMCPAAVDLVERWFEITTKARSR